ncbi:hypothetical protein K461DRAFT_296841 [Myriangium duriaei CBS 260.36]|uniref:J domain-containing protein n=1 Tax=Myriangium duriaei CBS 260.36 TaxID=1168546 RepID=A0A9P4MDY2_9PEZI|nr:hypothetical protein K461DRAFT_296841 [Myriangium duriaei CBS 260.36]
MVKPDVKVNYYAALELGADASIEDIKKQYKKLALKYHPDRNPGKEEEIVPKFQAIAAAHEVLSDPTTKAKYDGDRRRANLTGAPPAKPAASGQRGNPYTATSNFAPPPRRTADPTGWTRPNRPATGADRYANFPGPGPTSRQGDTRKTTASEAWSHLGGQKKQQSQARPGPGHGPQQQRRPPPVPPRDNAAPPPRPDLPKREDEIRAGVNYRPAPSYFANAAERTAYAHFNAANANAQRPGVHRMNTTTTPRKGGFDPNTPGSDERPPAGPSAYANMHDNSTTKPQYRDYMSQTSSHSNGSTDSGPTSGGTRPLFGEANRTSSTYAHTGGEKTYFSSDQLKRSHSTRDTTKIHHPPTARHRSASPTKKSPPQPRKAQTFGGILTDDSDIPSSESASSSDNSPVSQKGAFGTRPRPKKVPTSRLNGVNIPPTGNQSPLHGRRLSQQSQPSRKNSLQSGSDSAGQNNMYEPPFFDSERSSGARPAWSDYYPFGPTKPAPDARRGTIPQWAIPSSVNFRSSGKQDKARTTFQQDGLSYVEETPLIDVNDHNQNRTSSSTTTKPKSSHFMDMHLLNSGVDGFVNTSEEDIEHDLADLTTKSNADMRQNSFTIPAGLDNNGAYQNRSADNINTMFSTSGNAPTFTSTPTGSATASPTYPRRTSPSKRGVPRRARDAPPSRGSSNFINTGSSQDQVPSPMSPAPTPNSTRFSDQASARNFAAENWADHFGHTAPRRPSQTGSIKGTAVPHPVTVQDTSDTSDGRESTTQHEPTAADAMDIDPTPPAQSKPARQYSIPPSQWRLSQNAGQQMSQSGRRSSVRSNADAGAQEEQRKASVGSIPSLEQLSATLNQPNDTGLNDLSSLNSSIPFTSKPATSHPAKLFTPNDYAPAPLPQFPNAPDAPTKLSRSIWKDYTARMASYMSAWHSFQRLLTDRSQSTSEMEVQLLSKGAVGLEARGETSTDVSIEAYLRRSIEDQEWVELGSIAQGKHIEALKKYLQLKDKVRQMADGSQLPE